MKMFFSSKGGQRMNSNINLKTILVITLVMTMSILYSTRDAMSVSACPGNTNNSGMLDIIVGPPSSGPDPDFSAALIGIMDFNAGGLSSGLDWMHSDYLNLLESDATSFTPTNATGSQVTGWWSQKNGRNSFITVSNADSMTVTVHVQIFNESCTPIRDFCDDYTGFDSHEYNLGDLFSNEGNDIADANLQGSEGFVVITAVDNCGTGNEVAIDHDYIAGNISIVDSNLDNAMTGINMYARQAACFDIPDAIEINEIENGSFQDSVFSMMNWEVLMGNAGVIMSTGITPNIAVPMSQTPDSNDPDSDLYMAYAASSSVQGVQTGPYGFETYTFNGGSTTFTPLSGFPYPSLAKSDFLNIGRFTTNQTVVESNQFTTTASDTLTYDLRWLAPSNSTFDDGTRCRSFAAVVVVDTSVPEFVDAECYNIDGTGSITINQDSGPMDVPCTQTPTTGSNSITPFSFNKGASDLIQGSLSIPSAGTYTVQFISGQEAHFLCSRTFKDDPNPDRDVGALVDNFRVLGFEDDMCTGDLTGADNAKLDDIVPSQIWGLFDTQNSIAGSDTVIINYADDYGPPYNILASSPTLAIDIFDDNEGSEFCLNASGCFLRVGINDTLVGSEDYNPRVLTLTKTGSGSVTSDVPGIDCGSGCSEDSAAYADGTVVTLTATPEVDNVFNSWGGNCSSAGSDPTVMVTMDSAQNCTADFGIIQRTLDVVIDGTGSGTVTSSPPGINCETDCTEDYDDGEVITLSNTPAPNSVFVGYTGTGCTSGTVTMDDDRTCTATFDLKPTLTIVKAGAGTGTVTTNPAGIDCGATCDAMFNPGESIVMTGNADPDSFFVGFTGAGCTTGTVTLNSDTTCTAVFDLIPQFNLTITKNGTGAGTVTTSPAGINCGGTCTAAFDENTIVALNVLPNVGSVFAGWSGNLDCSDGMVTMSGARDCTATFNLQVVPNVTLLPIDPGQGGVVNNFTVTGATPNGPVQILWSFNEATFPDDGICPGFVADINNPRVLTTLTANGSGTAVFARNLPNNIVGITFKLQAVDLTPCEGSNVTTETIDPSVPQNAPVLNSMQPGAVGPNTLTSTNHSPVSPVGIIWGFNEGLTNAGNLCPGLQVGITNFNELDTTVSDQFGNVTINVTVPLIGAGLTVKLQSIDLVTCTPSNVTTESF